MAKHSNSCKNNLNSNDTFSFKKEPACEIAVKEYLSTCSTCNADTIELKLSNKIFKLNLLLKTCRVSHPASHVLS